MNKSMTNKTFSEGPFTDRSKAKSTQKQVKFFNYTRQIIIKTDEPDIPQITILKVQRPQNNKLIAGYHGLQRIFERIKQKNLYQGLSQICKQINFHKIKKDHANIMFRLLKSKQKKLINFSWLKLQNLKYQQKSKRYTIKLLTKTALSLVNRNKSIAFDQIKTIYLDRIKKNIIQLSQSNIKKAETNFQVQISKIKNQQYSEHFISICKKFMKVNKNYHEISMIELQPSVSKQVQRYKQFRNNQGSPFNNQIVLIILSNNLLMVRQLKKDLDSNVLLLKQFQKQDIQAKLSHYLQIQKQFEKADNQVKESFEKNKKINQKQLCKIIESHLQKWNKARENSLYSSRLFISAIIVKLIKQNTSPLTQFLDKVQNFLQFSGDVKKLQQLKKKLNENQRSSLILLKITNKFIDLNTFGMQPIMEKGFSQNQQTFMQQINYIRQQVKDLITKYNNLGQRAKIKKTLTTRLKKAPQQLGDLYVAINQLIGLILKNDDINKQVSPLNNGQKSTKTQMMKILVYFRDCLKQGNYQKWEKFLQKQVNQQFKQLISLLDKLNDILNQKINEQTHNKETQIEKLRNSQTKFQEQLNNYKAKIKQLQKRIKSSQNNKAKQTNASKQKQIDQLKKIIKDWENKYNSLNLKYQKLEKNQEKSSSLSKTKQRQLNQLKILLETKDRQIEKSKQESKNVRDKSKQKNKIQQQKKALQAQIQKQLKQLQNYTQKLKIQLQNKYKLINDYENKINNYQSQLNKLYSQLKSSQSKNLDQKNITQFEEIANLNNYLKSKINQLTQKIQSLNQKLQSKQIELQNVKDNLLSQQKNQIIIMNMKNQYDSLIRKINILNNTIQGLKSQQERKTKILQQIEKQKINEQNKEIKPINKVQKNAEHSLQLIKQLNKQLQKLKRSQITLEEINKQLQHVHHHSEDVQAIISRIQRENNNLKKSIAQKDIQLFQKQTQINGHKVQIDLANTSANKLYLELQDRQKIIKRIQASMKDRQNLMNQQLNNKKDYIRKLEDIIKANELALTQLSQKIKNSQDYNLTKLKNQAQKKLQKTLNQLIIENEKNRKLQVFNKEIQSRYLQLQNIFRSQKIVWQQDKRNWQIQKQIIQSQIRFWSNQAKRWQEDRQKLNYEKQNFEIQWKDIVYKYETSTTQNKRLLVELSDLNKIIEQLKYQISLISGKQINVENIVWLLSNITASFIRIHPKPSQNENSKTSEQIFRDLMAIKQQLCQKQNQMFMNFEDYVVRFIQSDIGRYRYDLIIQINDLTALREKLMQFLSNQIQTSKKSLNYQYNYELRQKSTAASKTFYQTPIKQSQVGIKISQQIRQIKEKTLHAQKLFESQQLKR